MKIASWNVNSLRARISHVERWLTEEQPDAILLQETKVCDAEFPTDTFSRLGYETVRSGQKSYNGVAILARHSLHDVKVGLDDAGPDEDRRLIGARMGDLWLYSAYVPNGKSLDSPHYEEKLKWLKRLTETIQSRAASGASIVLGGDFNVARDERDVFSVAKMEGQLHFTRAERTAIENLLQLGLEDVLRVVDHRPQLYSWWDYRMNSFERNRGLRIDYLFASSKIAERLTRAGIDARPRAWEKPSDHAPMVVEFTAP